MRPLHSRLCCLALGGRGPHCLNSQLKRPLSYALTGPGARTYTLDIPIVPHVTAGPERAHPSHTLTHACTHAHTQTHGHFPTPSRPPPEALRRHSLTVTHLHSFTDTHTPPHIPTTDTFINRARRSTHAPLCLAYCFRSPESFLPPPRAPHFPVRKPTGRLENSWMVLFTWALVLSQFPLPLCVPCDTQRGLPVGPRSGVRRAWRVATARV